MWSRVATSFRVNWLRGDSHPISTFCVTTGIHCLLSARPLNPIRIINRNVTRDSVDAVSMVHMCLCGSTQRKHFTLWKIHLMVLSECYICVVAFRTVSVPNPLWEILWVLHLKSTGRSTLWWDSNVFFLNCITIWNGKSELREQCSPRCVVTSSYIHHGWSNSAILVLKRFIPEVNCG